MIYNKVCEDLLNFYHLKETPCKYCGKPTFRSCGCCYEKECNDKYYNDMLRDQINYILTA